MVKGDNSRKNKTENKLNYQLYKGGITALDLSLQFNSTQSVSTEHFGFN